MINLKRIEAQAQDRILAKKIVINDDNIKVVGSNAIKAIQQFLKKQSANNKGVVKLEEGWESMNKLWFAEISFSLYTAFPLEYRGTIHISADGKCYTYLDIILDDGRGVDEAYIIEVDLDKNKVTKAGSLK